jgi:hypothetical protein
MQNLEIPAELPESQRASGTLTLRYEDVAQDGRLRLETFPHGVGTIFGGPLAKHPLRDVLRREMIIPILTRFVIEGEPGPFSVFAPLSVRGAFDMSHAADTNGQVERIQLEMWIEMTGPIGRTNLPPPENKGTVVRAGRMFAEHVFTRPFAPPDQRKVLRFDGVEGMDPVPPRRRDTRAMIDIVALPPGARAIDERMEPDPTRIAFGLAHTDSNQHVNSLVYPRLFEEAALRRFAALGKSTTLLARSLEIGFRKPCFAGDDMRIAIRAFEDDRGLGAAGVLVPSRDPQAKPHVFATMRFA